MLLKPFYANQGDKDNSYIPFYCHEIVSGWT